MQTDKKEKILRALSSERWLYRTVDGIAKETKLPKEEVKRVLDESRQKVRVSRIRSKKGKVLYASKNRVSSVMDLWTAFRAISRMKVAND